MVKLQTMHTSNHVWGELEDPNQRHKDVSTFIKNIKKVLKDSILVNLSKQGADSNLWVIKSLNIGSL